MTQGVIHQDSQGRIISVNPAAERIMGLNHYNMQEENSNYHCKAIHEDGTEFPDEKHPSTIALKTGKEVKKCSHGCFKSSKKEL